MLAALLTTLFFSLSSIFGNRSVRELGGVRANVARLLFAAFCLGAYAHVFGPGLGGAGRDWFLLSGIIGMGLGDLALYAALPLLGARLSVLMTQCLAAPIAIVAEWLWLDTALTATQLACGAVAVAGVAWSLMPSKSSPPRVAVKPIGFFYGLLAAAGQGLGAVVSRHANAVTVSAGESIDGLSAAYPRILGGLMVALAYFAVLKVLRKDDDLAGGGARVHAREWRRYQWVPLNALAGAVLGVGCYQWALLTTPSGLVLPIVACTPLMIIPLSRWLEGERPTRRSLVGAVVAVSGVIGLTLAR